MNFNTVNNHTLSVPDTHRGRERSRRSRHTAKSKRSSSNSRASSRPPSYHISKSPARASHSFQMISAERRDCAERSEYPNIKDRKIETTLLMLGVDREYIEKALEIAHTHFREFDIEGIIEIIYRIKILDNLHLMKLQRQSVFDSREQLEFALTCVGFSADQIRLAFVSQSSQQKSQEFTQYDLKEMTQLILDLRDTHREREDKKPYNLKGKYMSEKTVPVVSCDTASESPPSACSDEKYDEKDDEDAEGLSLFEMSRKGDATIPLPDFKAEHVLTIDQQLKAIKARNGDIVNDMFDELFEFVLRRLQQQHVRVLKRIQIDGVAADTFEDFSEEHSERFQGLGWSMTSSGTSMILERI